MTYTIIIDKDGEQLVFKGILYFLAEPGRIKMLHEKWITVDDYEGLILHEESDMSRLSDDEKRYLTDQITMLKNENERLTKYVEYSKGDKECMQNEIDVLRERPAIKMSDGDVWLVFPDATVSIEGICRSRGPGPIVKRNLRKWREGILDKEDE